MNPSELRILEQIEDGFWEEDATFAQAITAGPRLSGRYRVGLAAVVTLGVSLVMLFSVNLVLGLAGYAVLVGAFTSLLRRRPVNPVNQSPLTVFHRLTAGLFRNTEAAIEAGLD